MNRLKSLKWLAAIMTTALFLAACSTTTQAPTGTAEKPFKRIVIATGSDTSSWDPPADWITGSEHIELNIYDCLVWRNRETMVWEPVLATKMTNIDPTTWRFELRKGVKFHDGEEFDAQAIKFTYERILANPKFITHNQWRFLKEVKIIDPFTVDVITVNPEPAFLSKMAGTGCGVVGPKYVAKVGNEGLAKHGIGTGPFMLKEHIRDEKVVLVAFDGHWRGRAKIDEIVYRNIPESSTRVAELLSGNADLLYGIPAQDIARVQNNANLKIEGGLSTMVQLLTVKHNANPGTPQVLTNDPKVRLAIDYAIDKMALIKLVGGGVPTMTRVVPPMFGHNAKLYNTQRYDQAKAKQYLAEAGFPNGGAKITFHVGTGAANAKILGETITEMLNAVGFVVDLQLMEPVTYREQIYVPGNNRELLLEGLSNGFFHAWLPAGLTFSAPNNRHRYDSPELKALAEKALVTMDPAEQNRMYMEIQEKALEIAAGINLYRVENKIGMSKRLQWPIPADDFTWMYTADVIETK